MEKSYRVTKRQDFSTSLEMTHSHDNSRTLFFSLRLRDSAVQICGSNRAALNFRAWKTLVRPVRIR